MIFGVGLNQQFADGKQLPSRQWQPIYIPQPIFSINL